MKTYTEKELKNILDLHAKWLKGKKGGERANLSDANLSYASLSNANLSYASLSFANLSYARLSGANLSRANLSYANLSCADLTNTTLPHSQIVPEYGSFYGYKKLGNNEIALLYVPKSAKRVGGLIGRKCRVSKALVKAIYVNGVEQPSSYESKSKHDQDFVYKVGAWVKPKEEFNSDIREECTSGIHLFLTRKEAEEY